MDNFFRHFVRRREVNAPVPIPVCPEGEKAEPAKKATGGNFRGNTVSIGNEHAALKVSAWYRAAEVLANTMGMLVLEYQVKKKGHSGYWENAMREEEDKHLNYLLQVRPNPLMPAVKFWKQMTLNRFHQGNGVAYIERVGGIVQNIWLCTNAAYNVVSDEYVITYDKPGIGSVSKTVKARDVIHWRNTFSYDGGVTGVGTLDYARQSLSTAATSDKQAREIAAKGGKFKILLQEENKPEIGFEMLTKNQKEQQKNDFQEALNNGDDVILMSGLMGSQVISQDAQSQQLLESRKYDTAVVGRFSGVPLYFLMDYTNNTYKAPEQATQALYQNTISPMATELENELNSKLIGEFGWDTFRFKFNDKMLMRLDPMGRANLLKLYQEMGINCVNESRAELNLAPVNGGDRHLVSTNLQPLDDLRVTGAQPTTEKGGTNGNA